MTAGHLQIKNGNYYAVMNYMTAWGDRKQKWIPLGMPAKGNKKKAEEELIRLKLSYVPPKEDLLPGEISPDMLFCDYLKTWLEIIEKTVEKTTYNSYRMIVSKKIIPYFEKQRLKLNEIEARHIQSFYTYELRTVSGKTVVNEHNLIHRALKYAVKMDLIDVNPADKVDRPKKEKYIADHYRADELDKLFEATKVHPYSLLIQMTAFYGLRRGEVLGLRWDAIDFEAGTVTIRHVALETAVNGVKQIVFEDRAKTKSSLRTLPLTGDFKEKLLKLKERQEENRRIAGKCYNTKYSDYTFVDPLGNLFHPDTVTSQFKAILRQNGLREIRFHDLRHSCASLLLSRGAAMKEIQEWMGHSNISTTADIYSHLDYSTKIASAGLMDGALTIPKEDPQSGWKV